MNLTISPLFSCGCRPKILSLRYGKIRNRHSAVPHKKTWAQDFLPLRHRGHTHRRRYRDRRLRPLKPVGRATSQEKRSQGHHDIYQRLANAEIVFPILEEFLLFFSFTILCHSFLCCLVALFRQSQNLTVHDDEFPVVHEIVQYELRLRGLVIGVMENPQYLILAVPSSVVHEFREDEIGILCILSCQLHNILFLVVKSLPRIARRRLQVFFYM